MFVGLYDLIRSNFFPPKSTIVAIHTGGLQGLQGLKQRKMI
jgi:1-aminocyclopropane-1-carboxylate deaminase